MPNTSARRSTPTHPHRATQPGGHLPPTPEPSPRPPEAHPDLAQAFRHAPISLRGEDFSAVRRRLDGLRERGVRDLGAHLQGHPDEVLELARLVRVLDVNDATRRLLGVGGPEAFHDGLDLVFDKASYEVFVEEVVALAGGRTRFSGVAAHLTPRGERREVVVSVAVPPGYEDTWSRVYVSLTAVTSLVDAERECRASEQKYRKLFAASPPPQAGGGRRNRPPG